MEVKILWVNAPPPLQVGEYGLLADVFWGNMTRVTEKRENVEEIGKKRKKRTRMKNSNENGEHMRKRGKLKKKVS